MNAAREPRWVVIQRNPKSGTGTTRALLGDLSHALRRRGMRVRMFKSRDRLQSWLDDPERRVQVAALVAAGGDGTVADLANRFPGIPLAILPLGTENLLAKHFEIPASGEAVA